MLAAVLLGMTTGMASCKGCGKGAPEAPTVEDVTVYHDYDGVAQDFTEGVAQIQALHRQTMYSTLGIKYYEWRNSKVLFNDNITTQNIDELYVTDVNDVFFYYDYGPWVQFINSNVSDGLQIAWPIQDVWIEDRDLSESEIKLTAEDVLQRLKEWNGIIPHSSRSMSLRLPVGPKNCNAQWVIGNVSDVIFVDAVTGEISDWNPAFNPDGI